MVAQPFIEHDILSNADEIDEFLLEHGYDETDLMIFICEDSEFGGWFAEFALIEDEEVVAITDTWEDRAELKEYLLETLGDDYTITKHE